MINFGELELSVNTKYSFVGIQKEGSEVIFHIPRGFSGDDIRTFDAKRDLFFRLYRVLNVFKQICIEKGYFETGVVTKTDDRDGVVEDDTGSEIDSNNDSKNIFYSKIDALGSILDAYNELKILGLVSRLRKSEKLDYSKLHRYLNNAVFLNNGAIYIDAMNLPRKEIHFDATDIVAMYCYIFTEIKEQLKQEVNSEISSLAERFQEKYLSLDCSLFNEKYYLQVINDLKDALELIDNYTPIKDSDYWDFYEAIEKFLFGEFDNSVKGKVWGFSNFHSIWESMCLTYLVKTVDPDLLLYLDKQFISDKVLSEWNNCNKILNISGIFRVNGTNVLPDAVILSYYLRNIINNLKRDKNLIVYNLRKGNTWDKVPGKNIRYYTEFGLNTITRSFIKNCPKWIRIAYHKQSSEESNHTFYELQKIFPTNSIYIKLSSLPHHFYSYWTITDKLSNEEIRMMYNLNHIFVVALNNGFLCFKDFYEKYLEPYEIFIDSLLKGAGGKENLAKLFQEFLKITLGQFSIIDIKYSTCDYYINSDDYSINSDSIEEIKSRSVRKQFVYEYLLQKHLEKINHPLKELNIKSEFWLPYYFSRKKTLTSLPIYMDDYIKLTGVNIMAVIYSYLETEEK